MTGAMDTWKTMIRAGRRSDGAAGREGEDLHPRRSPPHHGDGRAAWATPHGVRGGPRSLGAPIGDGRHDQQGRARRSRPVEPLFTLHTDEPSASSARHAGRSTTIDANAAQSRATVILIACATRATRPRTRDRTSPLEEDSRDHHAASLVPASTTPCSSPVLDGGLRVPRRCPADGRPRCACRRPRHRRPVVATVCGSPVVKRTGAEAARAVADGAREATWS